jgi:hypothetical protein
MMASAWEALAHQHILHASPKHCRAWRHCGGVGQLLRRARFNHLVHHALVRSPRWKRQHFLHSQHLSPAVVNQLQETDFGETIHPTLDALALFSGIPLLISIPIYITFSPQWTPLGIVIAALPFVMTRSVHPLLHNPLPAPQSIQESGFWQAIVGWLRAVPLAYLRRYHSRHHRQDKSHYNLLLGFDFFVSKAK